MSRETRTISRIALRIALLLSLLAAPACDDQRARDATEKLKGSLQSKSALALGQKASAEEIKQAQEALTIVKEYMGEVTGKLDAVTVNAIQAFQRSHGLKDDGILDAETNRLLSEVKAKNAAS